VKAKDSNGWLVDYSGSMDNAIEMAWKIASDGDHGLKRRAFFEGKLEHVPQEVSGLKDSGDQSIEDARKAILDCVARSCAVPSSEALLVQTKHSGNFMTTPQFRKGVVGTAYTKTWLV